MRFMWIHMNTTGLNPTNSGVFEIGFMPADNSKPEKQKLFRLNPLSRTIKYHADSALIHGFSEDDICSFPSEKEQMPIIAKYLEENTKTGKMTLAGYSLGFSIKHLSALFNRNGLKLKDYFESCAADVFLQVKIGRMKKVLSWMPNMKLESVASYFGIKIKNRTAPLQVINTAYSISKELENLGVKLITYKHPLLGGKK